MVVYQYIRKYLQQFKSSYRVKFSVVALSSVVLGTVGLGLISQSMHAIPFTSALTSAQSGPQQHSKVTPTPAAKANPMPSLARLSPDLSAPTPAPEPTEAAPAPTQAPVTGGSSGDVVSIIDQVFGSYASGAVNVASCESGLNPAATGPSGAAGLFQILPSTFDTTSEAGNSPYDAYSNTVAAYDIFVRDGYSWSEWTCQP